MIHWRDQSMSAPGRALVRCCRICVLPACSCSGPRIACDGATSMVELLERPTALPGRLPPELLALPRRSNCTDLEVRPGCRPGGAEAGRLAIGSGRRPWRRPHERCERAGLKVGIATERLTRCNRSIDPDQ